MTNTPFLIKVTQQALKMGSLNLLEINQIPSLDLKVSFVVLPKCPKIVPEFSRTESEVTKHAKCQVCVQKMLRSACNNAENWES